MGKARIVYSSDQQSCFPDAVKNDVFAVIGPFNSFGDKAALQAAIEAEVRHYNRTSAPIDGTGWAEAAFCDDVDPASRDPGRYQMSGNIKPQTEAGDWNHVAAFRKGNNYSQNAVNSYREAIERAAANALNCGQGE